MCASALPSLNRQKILALSQPDFVKARENLLFVGNSGTGKKWLRPELVILDELGYVSLSRSGSELLFQSMAARYEQGSVAHNHD